MEQGDLDRRNVGYTTALIQLAIGAVSVAHATRIIFVCHNSHMITYTKHLFVEAFDKANSEVKIASVTSNSVKFANDCQIVFLAIDQLVQNPHSLRGVAIQMLLIDPACWYGRYSVATWSHIRDEIVPSVVLDGFIFPRPFLPRS